MASSQAAAGYIPSLDGLRAISIAVVFFAHAGLSPLIPGGFGVTVFFFLSGYLITALLLREWRAHGSIALGAFYLRRVVRLGPPLLITLAAASALVLAGYAKGDLDPLTITSQIFFFYNYLSLFSEGISVAGLQILWSLSVEEHFYLFYPFLFIAMASGRLGIRSLVVLVLLALAWRCVRFFMLGDGVWAIYVSTDTRFDSMLYGCLLAQLEGKRLAERWLTPKLMYPLLALSAVALLASFAIQAPAFQGTLRYTIQGLALMPVFYYAVNYSNGWLFRPLNWKAVRRVGQYSYTLYLIHYVIIRAMEFNGMDKGNSLVFIPTAMILSLAYAALVYQWAEKPLKPLRARLTGHGSGKTPAGNVAPAGSGPAVRSGTGAAPPSGTGRSTPR